MMRLPSSTLATLALAGVLLSSPPGLGACPQPAPRAAVALRVAEGIQGFTAMDAGGFARARDQALAALPCLGEPLPRPEVAAFHGLMAMDAFFQDDDVGAVNSFRAALAADTSWTPPEEAAPKGHPLQVQFAVARTLTGSPMVALPDLAPDTIMADGAPATSVPADRPTLLQRLSATGAVLDTFYLPAGAPLPAWTPPTRREARADPPPVTPVLVADDVQPMPVAPDLGLTVQAPVARRRPVGLAVGTGVSLLASGTCYGLAWRSHDAFVNARAENQYPEDPEALQAQANGLTWASIGAAALALGLGTVTVIRW